MAMTLGLMKGKIKVEIQDHNPGTILPNQNSEVRRAVAQLARSIGGVRSEATVVTVVDQREYDDTEGFPTDAIAIFGVFNTSKGGSRIRPMPRVHRSETGSSGNPSGYYIYNRRKIGFDVPISEIMNIRVDYLGLGDQLSDDDDEILPSLPAVEDDSIWNAVIYEVASVYFRRKSLNDISDSKHWAFQEEKYRLMASKARFRVMSDMNNMNNDEGLEILIDDGYFGYGGRDVTEMRRFGNSGDIIRIM